MIETDLVVVEHNPFVLEELRNFFFGFTTFCDPTLATLDLHVKLASSILLEVTVNLKVSLLDTVEFLSIKLREVPCIRMRLIEVSEILISSSTVCQSHFFFAAGVGLYLLAIGE